MHTTTPTRLMRALAGTCALFCLLLTGAQAHAADPAPSKQVDPAATAETLKKAINSQGDITPETRAALSKTEEGRKALEAADQRKKADPAAKTARPGQNQSATPGGKGKKSLYGDIIIYK